MQPFAWPAALPKRCPAHLQRVRHYLHQRGLSETIVASLVDEGKYEREWGASFYGPRGVAVDAEGDVFVSDTGNNRIVRFSSEALSRAAL